MEQAALRSGGVTIPGDASKIRRCGTEEHGLVVDSAILG